MLSGDGRTVTFDNLDRAIAVTMGGVTTQFRYAPDGQRYVQYTSGVGASPYPKAVFYVDKFYERIDWSSAASEEKTYIGTSIAVYKQDNPPPGRPASARAHRALHRQSTSR